VSRPSASLQIVDIGVMLALVLLLRWRGPLGERKIRPEDEV
jgi:hypothetical protein